MDTDSFWGEVYKSMAQPWGSERKDLLLPLVGPFAAHVIFLLPWAFVVFYGLYRGVRRLVRDMQGKKPDWPS